MAVIYFLSNELLFWITLLDFLLDIPTNCFLKILLAQVGPPLADQDKLKNKFFTYSYCFVVHSSEELYLY